MQPFNKIWFKSYLSERRQRCVVNGQMSDFRTLSCGIPQGTIIGPLLFLIYINDLPNCLDFSDTKMYADDTNLTVASPSSHEIEQKLNKDLENIGQWLKANRLSLNTTKTEFLLVKLPDRDLPKRPVQ